MRIPKRYGESRIDRCPFCSKTATTANKQGVPVCSEHKDKNLDLKCICGEYLDVMKGKWGPYFRCLNCGNISFKKGLSMNQTKEKKAPVKVHDTKKEAMLTPEDIDIYFS